MWREKFKPLSADLWVREIERLAVLCAQWPRNWEDRAVRRAYHLMMIAPLPLRDAALPELLELESMLDEGETAKAARAVLRNFATVQTFASLDQGRHVARLTIARETTVVCFEAATPALAIVGAWAQFLTMATN